MVLTVFNMDINKHKNEIHRKFPRVKGEISEESLIAAGYEGIFPTGLDTRSFIKAIFWCNENTKGEVEYMGSKFWFTDSSDAFEFKMVWL
jgi:hypothetical protein